MFDPPRRSPPAARARSDCAAASPLPRSSRVKHFDSDTKTLIRASGDSRLYCCHQLCSGSMTERVPIFFSHVGMTTGFGSAPHAPPPSAATPSDARAAPAAIRCFVMEKSMRDPSLEEYWFSRGETHVRFDRQDR